MLFSYNLDKPWYLLIMKLQIQRILKEYISENSISKLNEGSKRTKLHPRTLSDLNYITDIIWTDSKEKNDDPPFKGTIYVEDSTGAGVDIPVYYLSNFENQGAVFQINPDKPRNLYNLFIIVNPEESAVVSRKSLYNTIYHELQHLIDLHTTHNLTDKEKTKYDSSEDQKYYGHDFEFRAYTNEFLEGLENEYLDLIKKYDKDVLFNSLASLLDYFGRSGEADKIAGDAIFNISSETRGDDPYPHSIKVLTLLKRHNPKRWNQFLKMLYSTIMDIKRKIEDQYQDEMVEQFKKPRKMSKSYCNSTPCKDMGFSQKASCRPYKNCYKS